MISPSPLCSPLAWGVQSGTEPVGPVVPPMPDTAVHWIIFRRSEPRSALWMKRALLGGIRSGGMSAAMDYMEGEDHEHNRKTLPGLPPTHGTCHQSAGSLRRLPTEKAGGKAGTGPLPGKRGCRPPGPPSKGQASAVQKHCRMCPRSRRPGHQLRAVCEPGVGSIKVIKAAKRENRYEQATIRLVELCQRNDSTVSRTMCPTRFITQSSVSAQYNNDTTSDRKNIRPCCRFCIKGSS